MLNCRRLITLLLMLIAYVLIPIPPAMADTAELSWTPPTARTDGTALAPDEIGGYILKMNGNVLRDDISGDAVAISVENLQPGEHCFEIATRDTEDREGPFSDAACRGIRAEPGAVTDIGIRIVR